MFPGHAVLERGYLYANDRSGLGIDVDEEKAAALPDAERITPTAVRHDRRADGTLVHPEQRAGALHSAIGSRGKMMMTHCDAAIREGKPLFIRLQSVRRQAEVLEECRCAVRPSA